MARRYRNRYTAAPIKCHGGMWQPPFPTSANTSPRTFKCPLPESDAEFEILSEIIYGKPLHVSKLLVMDHCYGQIEIAEKWDDYAPRCAAFSYEPNTIFLRTIAGPMHTSATLGWTDFRRYGHRHWLRMQRWSESRRNNDSRTVRPAFVRLARRFGVGENIVGRVDRRSDGVLTSGRVDGALAVSQAGGLA